MSFSSRITICALLALPFGSDAAVVTLNGTDVDFTFDNSLLSLFGTPAVSGDSLIFSPTTFVANAANLAGLVVTNATMNVTVTPHAGQTLSNATLFEQGDYFRQEVFTPNSTAVAVLGQFIVDGTNAYSIAPAAPLSSVITSFLSPAMTPWTSTTIAALSGSSAQLTVQNILWAVSMQLGSGAFIEKKLVQISVDPAPVPIPAPVMLFMSALAGVFVVSRRNDKITRLTNLKSKRTSARG